MCTKNNNTDRRSSVCLWISTVIEKQKTELHVCELTQNRQRACKIRL